MHKHCVVFRMLWYAIPLIDAVIQSLLQSNFLTEVIGFCMIRKELDIISCLISYSFTGLKISPITPFATDMLQAPK